MQKVSIHGGHSGEFCNHAKDKLEDIIKTYIKKNFVRVGITEHIPPINDKFMYDDEKQAGETSVSLYKRFEKYIETCRKLQKFYQTQIEINTAFETETYTGYEYYIPSLVEKFKPDYIVGSVHHVNDINFDFSSAHYERAIKRSGSLDSLYCEYFDLQCEMLEKIKPKVVGHFDLIRLFDKEYKNRLAKPDIKKRIKKNLELIESEKLIMDFNVRSLYKGATEPYISEPILQTAIKMGIEIIPGDDSHGVDTVGLNIETAIKILQKQGVSINL